MYMTTTAVGRLTADPTQSTYGDRRVTRFSIAVDDGFGDKKTTDFVNCSAWNERGDNVMKFTKKGSLVLVDGRFKSSKKDKTTFWEMRADDVRFLSPKSETAAPQQPQAQAPIDYGSQSFATTFDPNAFVPGQTGDDNLPF